MSPHALCRRLSTGAGLSICLLALALTPGARAEATSAPVATGGHSSFDQFIDDLPFINYSLPTLGPEGLFRLYTHPHFGDFLHRDYLRVPVGVKAKIDPNLELSGELQSYFTHGLKGSAGYGLSGLLFGSKYEKNLPGPKDAAWSAGVNFSAPLSRPPAELTDGYRHTLPYVGATYPLWRKWNVLGYGTLAADLLSSTALPSTFGLNQLHANALSLSLGAARDWPRFRLTLTTTYATTALMSNETNHVFGVRPNVLIPIKPLKNSRLRVLLNLGGRAIWGPDKRELGFSSSLRVEFDLKTK